MSKINIKTDYEDGNILYGNDLNVNNNVIMLGVNDNYEKIKNLSDTKADVVYVDNIASSKADVSALNNQIASLNLTKANKSDLLTKADKEEVDLKADINYVDNQLNLKTDKTYTDNELSKKANVSDVYNKSYIDTNVINVLKNKADSNSVDAALLTKVNIDDFNIAMNKKADVSIIGDLDNLKTDNKSSVVDAINSINTEAKAIATVDTVGVVKPDGTTITIDQDGTIHSIGGGGTGGGTSDYNELLNKPQINDVEIKGNISLDALGIMSKSSIKEELALKADLENVYSKNYIDSNIIAALNDKANTTDVNTLLSSKADITDLESKADVSYVDRQLLLKADSTTVNNELNKKANIADVYNKTSVDNLLEVAKNGIDAKLLLKANSEDVYNKSEVSNLLKTRANNLVFENNKLQLTSDGAPIGDSVTIEVATNDVIIADEQPTGTDWKLWINSDEIQNLGSDVVNSLSGNETYLAPSVRATNEALAGLNNSIDAIRGKILWTNPNPTNEFNGQSITVNNLSDYDLIEIMYRKSTTEFYINSTKFPNIVGGGTTLLIPNTATAGVTYFRFASIEEGNVIKFTTGTNPGTGYLADILIPVYIIGYKTGLFSEEV